MTIILTCLILIINIVLDYELISVFGKYIIKSDESIVYLI